MKKFMEIAYKEALKAYENNEVPVGAVIVKDNKIISKAYNKKEKTNLVTSHAEILAINKACKKINNWRLNDCIMYVTLEPCMMCTGAILQSRIKKVVYSIDNPNYGFISKVSNKNIIVEKKYLQEINKKLLNDFFSSKRK